MPTSSTGTSQADSTTSSALSTSNSMQETAETTLAPTTTDTDTYQSSSMGLSSTTASTQTSLFLPIALETPAFSSNLQELIKKGLTAFSPFGYSLTLALLLAGSPPKLSFPKLQSPVMASMKG